VLQQAAAIAQLQQQLKQQLQQQQKQQQQQQAVSVVATTATPTPQRVVTTMSILGQGQAQPRVMARGKQCYYHHNHHLSVHLSGLVTL
jgi:hypothetical protein